MKLDKVHLVGHDWGAALAWALAGYYSNRFQTLTALSVGSIGNPGWKSMEQREKSWYFYFFQQQGLTEKALMKNDWELFKDFMGSHGEIDSVIKRLSAPNALTTALNWYRANMSDILTPCDGEYHGDGEYFPAGTQEKMKLPVLGIWSENDHFLLEPQMKQSETSVVNFTYHKIKNAGHWMMLDQPDELNKHLITFLKSQK